MELMSDLCPASGDGFAGYVDTDICFDDFGLPYIPSKRLKGCLRECGLDILSVDNSFAKAFIELFGQTGKFIPGTLNIGNGKLQNHNDILEKLGSAERSEITEVYTSIRSRTKMDGGKAAPGTLRTARVLNKGQVYEFPVTFSEDTSEFFKMCIKSLMSMGLNRSRGLGEIKCTLEEGESQVSEKITIEKCGQTSFSYTIELLEPVISAERTGKPQETESYIFGTAILGAFAVKYIEAKGLNCNEAYKDPDFRRVFLEGGVSFTAAMPSVKGLTYFPAPTVLRTDKLKTRLFDESLDVYDDKSDPDSSRPICKRLGGFFLKNSDGTVRTFSPTKIAFLHHARPANRSIAHATESGGEFYTYEALSAGQMFAGSVIGNKEDLQVLAGLLADSAVLRLGRSRTAQYGKIKIKLSNNEFAGNVLELNKGDTFILVAVTPIIVEDSNGLNKTNIELIGKSLGADYEIIRSICSETVVAGYYGKWLLPRRQESAIAEGSTIVFKYNGVKTTLCLDFIGKRTGEGFGQISLERIPEQPTELSFAKDKEITLERNTTVLPEVAKLRTNKDAVAQGIKYADTEKHFKAAPSNSTLERILTALDQADDYDTFARLIDAIKQPRQKIGALAFATRKDQRDFETEPDLDIASLLAQVKFDNQAYRPQVKLDYQTYRPYLKAAGRRIKEKRRNMQKTRKVINANV
jgi:CRISPR-associated protein Csx10